MSETTTPKETPFDALMRPGQQQARAQAINDFIFMAKDVSNAYLVTTPEGDLMVNTGFPLSRERNKALLEPHRTGPLRYIVITQSHGDHYGGVPAFREPGTQIVAERRFVDTCDYYRSIKDFSEPRTDKLFGKRDVKIELPQIVPDITVDGCLELSLGGRRFEIISTPGGETLDSIIVWMPDERIVFTGNLFGPVFLSMPFLNTIRGDKPRSVVRYLESLDLVRNLGAETLITGHDEPIRGAALVRADLDRMYAAVSYVNKAVIAGMNAGKDVYALMREIRLPEDLAIGEAHGNVRWAVRAIFHEYAGWFLYDSTTSLYDVPRSSVDADIVELAGGAVRLAERARAKLDAGEPLQAIHLIDIALGVEPRARAALAVKKEALERLLAESGSVNRSETRWLKAEIAETEAALAG